MFAGSVTLISWGAPNAAVCSSAPSASSGNTGGVWMIVVPHAMLGVPPAVTAGSAGNPVIPVVDSATR